MAGSVLNSTAVLRLNSCAKLNICASKSATSPSRNSSCYDESGMLNGNAIDYYDTGKIRVKYTYKNDKVVGLVSEYFKNGKLKCQDHNNDTGKIDGNSKCFDKKGNVTMHKIYKKGNLTKTIK